MMRRHGAQLCIVTRSPIAQRLLEDAGLAHLVDVRPTLKEALDGR
jgi:anti-anti-sigma regulatory factor